MSHPQYVVCKAMWICVRVLGLHGISMMMKGEGKAGTIHSWF
ncbi:MAG TPA: hypothetical protein VE573_20000 [Nitrososphaeraceae archaeon]|nr:hypothetical protein [Nitrososphaeraceae archaeon]